jgi:3-phosphoshikimate 1-carboxyvinyltransferase
VYLPGFRQYSLQGDSFVANLFAPLGVHAHFIGAGFRLKKAAPTQTEFSVNLVHNPDLAQTLAVAFAAKGFKARITGLQTLRLKETDRLLALKTELEKTGAQLEIGPDFLTVHRGIQKVAGVQFNTYQDHRMAMAFAPLALLAPIEIENPQVVEKSYGTFWKDLGKVGFALK